MLKSQALASFFAEGLLRTEEPADVRRARYAGAADALEKYLQLDPLVEDKQVWVEQLESLRVFGTAPKSNEERKIFSPKEVTTKARIVSKPEPDYTNEARANQVSGAVILRAVFAFDGTVKYLMVVQGLPYGLTEASVKSARRIKFVPATLDGRPVSTAVQLEYHFHIF